MSGVIEMDGFKDVFTELYNSSRSGDEKTTTLQLSNYSSRNVSSFCGSPENSASSCGSGNGANADSQIVSGNWGRSRSSRALTTLLGRRLKF